MIPHPTKDSLFSHLMISERERGEKRDISDIQNTFYQQNDTFLNHFFVNQLNFIYPV